MVCIAFPCQQNAVVEEVSKGLEGPEDYQRFLKSFELPKTEPELVIPFVTLEEVEKALERRVGEIDLAKLCGEELDRRRGRV